MGVFLPSTAGSGPESLAEYRRRGGYEGLARARTMDPMAIVEEIEASGLLGRGGAAFPTGRKWRMVAEAPSGPRYLVVNGAEGEPGSFKDRTLMARAPHRVLEGVLIAARAIGAVEALFYVNDQFVEAVQAMRQAWAEVEQMGWASVTLRIVPETHVYIAGEETALINVLMQRPAQPWHKPPYPTQAGYLEAPTVVNNVETLAAAALVLERSAAWFREERPALFSVSGDVRAPGVYELPLGTPLRTLLDMAGGPLDGDDWAAVLPGGYSMPPILPADFAVPLDPEALRALGSGLGASIIAVGQRRGLVSVLQDVLDFFARETCGKCPVCVKGSHVLAEEAGRLAEGRGGAGLEAAARKYRHKGICSFLDTAARFAEATMGQVG